MFKNYKLHSGQSFFIISCLKSGFKQIKTCKTKKTKGEETDACVLFSLKESQYRI